MFRFGHLLNDVLRIDKNPHPDSATAFEIVQHAYDVLSSTETRDQFNRFVLIAVCGVWRGVMWYRYECSLVWV